MEGSNGPGHQLRKALKKVIEAGFQVEPETLSLMEVLAGKGMLERAVEDALVKASSTSQRSLFLPRSFLEQAEPEPKPPVWTQTESSATQTEVRAERIESRIEILEDPGREAGATRDVEDLLHYFKDRFSRISDIFRERSDARNAITIDQALKAPPRTRNRIICIVTEKRERPRSLTLTVEDNESLATIVVSSSDRSTLDKARSLFLDQVVCIEVSRTQGEVLIGHDFLTPDIPDRPVKGSEEEVYAALLSDLHIGSQKYMSDPFKRFLDWVQGRQMEEKLIKTARRLKYIIIAGDLVDGIGVYPGQEKELAINDINKQYSEAAKVLSLVPEHIQVILIPGNHDATLQAIPQPPISEEFAGPLLDLKNVVNLGDPARIRLHGVEILVFHGRSLDDVVGTVHGVTYQNLNETVTTLMRSLIKARHLAPVYGSKTPIKPQTHDRLVIEKPPEIMHCGHIHVAGYELYRGTLLLNSGAWQYQTSYQERMGLTPTPGIAPLVNLKDLSVTSLNFSVE